VVVPSAREKATSRYGRRPSVSQRARRNQTVDSAGVHQERHNGRSCRRPARSHRQGLRGQAHGGTRTSLSAPAAMVRRAASAPRPGLAESPGRR
jgi:hypothetical protein